MKWGIIEAIKPLPTIQEAFLEVRREQNQRKLTMNDDSSTTPVVEGVTLYMQFFSKPRQ